MNHNTSFEPEDFGATSHAHMAGLTHGISGWPLPYILQLDDARRGFLAEACRRSDARWRQAVFAALASGVTERAADFLSRCGVDGQWGCGLGALARALLQLPARDIVLCALGSCPNGYLAVLERLRTEPMADASAYLRLDRLMLDRREGRRRRTILQLSDFDQDRLEAVERLDPTVLSPGMISKIKTGEAADRLNARLAMVRRYCSSATDEALEKSGSDHLSSRTGQSLWLRKWIERADQNLPEPPWRGDEMIRPLVTPADLASVGRRTRTCLPTKTALMLVGRVAYYICEGQEPVVACVVRLGQGSWLLTSLHGASNYPVSRERASDIRKCFGQAGIIVVEDVPDGPEREALFGLFDPFGDELEELENI